MLKVDEEYEETSKVFDYVWILEKVKMVVSGLDTKINLRVSLHDAIFNYVSIKQQSYETNDAYLTKFKSMVETLKIAGGDHILVSSTMLKMKISDATKQQINAEREMFMAVSFILRSDNNRFKN